MTIWTRPQERKSFTDTIDTRRSGTGGPAGDLPPVLNGVECCKCGVELGKRYKLPVSRGNPVCIDKEECNKRYEVLELACVKCGRDTVNKSQSGEPVCPMCLRKASVH